MSSRHNRQGRSVLGILGGMGPEATVNFQRELLQETPASKDQDHITTLVSNDPKIPDRNVAILDGGKSPLTLLQSNALMLETAGADAIAMPCNTAHYYFDEIRENIDIELINMIRITVDEVQRQGLRQVGLVATSTVIECKIYDFYFDESSINLVKPMNVNKLMKAIYEVKAGDNETAARILSKEIDNFEKLGCQGLVIGCTDLSLLNWRSRMRTFDSVKLLAKECVRNFRNL